MREGAPRQLKRLEWIGSSKKDLKFQKKSKSGIAMPKPDLDLIKERLKAAERRAKELEDERAQRHQAS